MLGRFVVDRAKGVVLSPRDARGRNLVAQFSVAQAAKDQNGSGLTEKFNGLPSTGTGLIPVSRGPQKRPSAALVARQAPGVESGGLCRASCSNPSHRDSRGADLAKSRLRNRIRWQTSAPADESRVVWAGHGLEEGFVVEAGQCLQEAEDPAIVSAVGMTQPCPPSTAENM